MSLHNSKVLSRHTPCLPEQRFLTFGHGTRATVRDLFGSMPVRVKHRALQAEKSSFSKDWDQLLLDLVALFIAWPSAVSVSIRESSSRQTLSLKTASKTWLSDSCRLLHQVLLCDSPSTSGWVSVGASAPTLSISGYVCREPVATKRIQFIALGIEPLSNEYRSNVLYEEVNRVFANSSFGAIDEEDPDRNQKDIQMGGFVQRDLKARKGVDRWPMFFLKISPASSAIQRPLEIDDILDHRQPSLVLITDLLKAMFYEFLNKNLCQPRKVALSAKSNTRRHRESDKSSGNIDAALTVSVKARQDSGQSPSSTQAEEPVHKASRLAPEDSRLEPSLDFWSKIKLGQTLPTFQGSAPPPSRTQSARLSTASRSRATTPGHGDAKSSRPALAEHSRPMLYDANGRLTRKPFEDIDPKILVGRGTREPDDANPPTPRSQQSPQRPLEDETFEWINPVTKMVSIVNSRTGFALPPRSLTLNKRASERAKEVGKTDSNSSLDTEEMTPWIGDLISKWKNPVFELTEQPIPKLPDMPDMLGIDLRPAGHNCNQGLPAFSEASHHEIPAMGLHGRLSKDTIKRATLIAQADSKFILAKVPFDRVTEDRKDPRSFLVLIDQHAADERCRVEALMKEYFKRTADEHGNRIWKAVTELLPKPLQFEVSSQDKSVLHRFQDHFTHWGIFYDVVLSSSGEIGVELTTKKMKKTKSKVVVRSLPPAIIERCRTEPRLLAELVRKEAWKLNDEKGLAQEPRTRAIIAGEDEKDGPAWVSLFHGCPQGIVELINSRSCRSAIMFNDPLSLDQCAGLLDRLVRCAFPFQCAHGRPSMVPLVDLGDGMVEIGSSLGGIERKDEKDNFGRRFMKWKQLRHA